MRTDTSHDPQVAAELSALAAQNLAPAHAPAPASEARDDDPAPADTVGAAAKTELSPQSQRRADMADRLAALRQSFASHTEVQLAAQREAEQGEDAEETPEEESEESGTGPEGELSESEEQQVRELRTRDREVKAHEQAHLAAAGDLAQGGASYTYQRGPDGQRYAIGGEVQIAVSKGRTPAETISRARRAQRAALAPAEPSSTDRAVARRAAGLERQAQQELAESTRAPEAASADEPGAPGPDPSPEHGVIAGESVQPEPR